MRKSKIFSLGGTGGGGGSVNTGVLQIAGGVALDTTLRYVEDQAGTSSPLQLSTTKVAVTGGGSFLVGDFQFTPNYSMGGYAQWSSTTTSIYHEWALSSNTDRYLLGLEPSGVGFVMYHSTATSGYIASFGTSKIDFNKNLLVGNYGGSASARLHVRGDGSNPIARFEDNTGVPMLRIENSSIRFGSSTPFGSLAYAMTGTTFSGNNNGTGLGFYSQFSIAGSSDRYDFGFGGDAVANDAGSVTHLALVRNFAAGAGAANFRPLGIYYTINNSGAQTGTATGIYLNATETALNSMTHNLMDLQIGGVSKFRVSPTLGEVTTAYNINAAVFLGTAASMSGSGGYKVGSSRIKSGADGVILLQDDAASSFTMLQFGGTSNTYPALKRSSTTLEVKLADDSAYTGLTAKSFTITGYDGITSSVNDMTISSNYVRAISSSGWHIGDGSYPPATAILELKSTTKGFLPPRMTGAQATTLAAASPAQGLLIFVTSTDGIFTAIGWWGYDGTNWTQL